MALSGPLEADLWHFPEIDEVSGPQFRDSRQDFIDRYTLEEEIRALCQQRREIVYPQRALLTPDLPAISRIILCLRDVHTPKVLAGLAKHHFPCKSDKTWGTTGLDDLLRPECFPDDELTSFFVEVPIVRVQMKHLEAIRSIEYFAARHSKPVIIVLIIDVNGANTIQYKYTPGEDLPEKIIHKDGPQEALDAVANRGHLLVMKTTKSAFETDLERLLIKLRIAFQYK